MSYNNPNTAIGFEELDKNQLVIIKPGDLFKMITTALEKLLEKQSSNAETKNKESGEEELLTMDEVLKVLKVSKVTIHNWKKKGLIKSNKIGRKLYFRKSELLEAVKYQKYKIT